MTVLMSANVKVKVKVNVIVLPATITRLLPGATSTTTMLRGSVATRSRWRTPPQRVLLRCCSQNPPSYVGTRGCVDAVRVSDDGCVSMNDQTRGRGTSRSTNGTSQKLWSTGTTMGTTRSTVGLNAEPISLLGLTNHGNVSCTVESCVDLTSVSVPLLALCCIFGDGIVMSISMAILLLSDDAVSVGGGRVHPNRPLQSRLVDFHMAPANFLSVSDVLGSDSRFNERTCGAKSQVGNNNNVRWCEQCCNV